MITGRLGSCLASQGLTESTIWRWLCLLSYSCTCLKSGALGVWKMRSPRITEPAVHLSPTCLLGSRGEPRFSPGCTWRAKLSCKPLY